jgi:two-component system OmpR family sensor kinase
VKRVLPATLHGRLLAGIALTVTLGLVGVDVALYVVLDSFLNARSDRQLHRIASAVDQALSRPAGLRIAEGMAQATVSGGATLVFLDGNGKVWAAQPQAASPQQVALLAMLETGALPVSSRIAGPAPVDLAGTPYRVLYHHTAGRSVDKASGATEPITAVVLAISFRTERDALGRLVVSEALVTTVAMLVLTGSAAGVLRLGLRPLAAIATAAKGIADGDTPRRITVDRPDSEVGQLAAALNQAFEERQNAEESLRRFVADASHELRTPLTTIRGWADLYQQGGVRDPARVDTAMASIADQADQVCRLVEELLLLARLDERRPLDAELVDLVALADEVITDARTIDPDRLIGLSPGGVDGTIGVIGDRDRLRQVVRNLVGNAMQHTPPGTRVDVTVQTDHTSRPATVLLTVADAGPGIAPADQRRIFERFYRTDPARDNASGGTGLGLAIVQAIVQAHGGAITVDSAPGAGTRFNVTLSAALPGAARPGQTNGQPVGDGPRP